MPVYIVRTEEYGELRKLDDNIAAARRWAKRAFPRQAVQVTREYRRQFCDRCHSAPCCCMVRQDV